MARLQGISGGLSGKTGSYTFRQSRGETIVSQYQPIVKNPNTQGQQNQRAKFKLMSQLAAIMAPGFGTMGVTKRPGRQAPTQRNAFVQLNMPLVIVLSSADSATAKIPMEQVQLTSSKTILGNLTYDGEGAVTCNVQNTAVSTIRFVEISYIENDVTRPVIRTVEDVVVEGERAVFNTNTASTNPCTVLAYGLIPTESASSATLDNLHTPTNENFIAAVQLNNLVDSGELVETMTIGLNFTA